MCGYCTVCKLVRLWQDGRYLLSGSYFYSKESIQTDEIPRCTKIWASPESTEGLYRVDIHAQISLDFLKFSLWKLVPKLFVRPVSRAPNRCVCFRLQKRANESARRKRPPHFYQGERERKRERGAGRNSHLPKWTNNPPRADVYVSSAPPGTFSREKGLNIPGKCNTGTSHTPHNVYLVQSCRKPPLSPS